MLVSALRLCPAIAAILAASIRSAPADESTDELVITARVQAGCALAGGSIDFGQYVPGQPTDLDAAGRIQYSNCLGTLVLELDGGQSGAVNNRHLRSDDSRIPYQIYRDSNRTVVWGVGNQSVTVQLFSLQSGSVTVRVEA